MHMSDQEQKQLIKDWWKKYGNAILAGILVFAVVNFSWRYWQQYQYQKMEGSSLMYMQMLGSAEQQKPDEAKLFAKKLMDDFSSTPYASLAAFSLAKEAVGKNDLDVAFVNLDWVIKHAKSDAFKQIAKIRAARILLAQKKSQEALDLLNNIDDKSFLAAIDEAKGDALIVLGKNDAAAKVYKEALELQKGEAISPLLKLKLEQF